jgi:RNA-directed DNA polymerase
MGYRPQPSRRSYIPKPGSEKGRPLGISSFEDKIVEKSLKRVMEQIYEADFENSSYGYRPGRGQHQCLDVLGRTIQQKRVNYVVEADIRNYFGKVNHEWLLKFLGHRIQDPRILRLVKRFLRSGVMEDGLVHATEEGIPQGSILSPLLSNVYLHYVLDLWFRLRVKKQCRGEAYYFRFADDFVACFQSKKEAEEFLHNLRDRLKKFNLQLAEEKTRCIEFGDYCRENARRKAKKPSEFTFLGFTHYYGTTKNGFAKVKRRTSRKKFGQALRRYSDWAQESRKTHPKARMLRDARAKVLGHLAYYSVTDNTDMCCTFVHYATRILFKWINRKSQRSCYTWEGFNDVLRHIKWPRARVHVDLNPYRRTAEAF